MKVIGTNILENKVSLLEFLRKKKLLKFIVWAIIGITTIIRINDRYWSLTLSKYIAIIKVDK